MAQVPSVRQRVTDVDDDTRAADASAADLQRPPAGAGEAAEVTSALRELVPDAFIGGELDLDALRGLLSDAAASVDERYRFTWLGQTEAARLALAPPDAALRPRHDASRDWDRAQNVFIEGDNLQVLKLISKAYSATAKLVYIDPPYNLGEDRIYRDDFSEARGDYLERTGQRTPDGELTVANPETSGRHHSAWLSLMYPRLQLARRLLRRDGAIAVAIDDTEVHHLRLLMDSVFGPGNFIATLVWEGGRKNDATFVSVGHDYTIVYAMDRAYLREQKVRWRVPKSGIDEIFAKEQELRQRHGADYAAMTAELRGWYARLRSEDPESPVLRHGHYKNVDERGVFFGGDIAWPGPGGPGYEVLHPVTRKPVKLPQNGWRYADAEEMRRRVAKGLVHFGEDETTVPTTKRYLHLVDAEVMTSVFYRDRRAGSKALTRLVGENIFDNPKDPDILRQLVQATTSESDLVVDFFAGSASSAEAVMRANAEDGGKRRWVMVQLPEKPRRKAPVKSLSAGSLRRVEAATDALEVPDETAGFRVFKLDRSAIDGLRSSGAVAGADGQVAVQTARSADARDELDEEAAVWELALREGYPLTSRIEGSRDGAYTLWTVSSAGTGPPAGAPRRLFVCLAGELDLDLPELFPAAQGGTLIVRRCALSNAVAADLAKGFRLKTV